MSKSETKSKIRKTPSSIGVKKFTPCDQFRFEIVDFVLLIAVLGALGFLLFPFAKIVVLGCVRIVGVGVSLINEANPYVQEIYRFPAFGMVTATLTSFMFLVLFYNCTNCERPGCKGLRKRRGNELHELTEEELRSYGNALFEDVVAVGLERYHRNAITNKVKMLRKLAPSNGRVVMIQRAACGCLVGKLEVAGRRSVPARGRIKK